MTSKRGRPRLSEGQAAIKQQLIIDAAKALFRVQGVESVSMRKIATKAGMGTMTLYQYFTSKTEILHHIWGEFFDELFLQMQAAADKSDKPLEKLRAAYHAYLAYFLGNPDRFRMVFLHEDRSDSQDRFFVDHARIEARLNDFFQPLEGELGLSTEELAMLQQSIICFLHGVMLNLISISEYDWLSGQSLLDHYLDTMLA